METFHKCGDDLQLDQWELASKRPSRRSYISLTLLVLDLVEFPRMGCSGDSAPRPVFGHDDST